MNKSLWPRGLRRYSNHSNLRNYFLGSAWVRIKVDQLIFLGFKPPSRFSYRYSLILYCPLKLTYTCMFSVSTNSLFGHVFTIQCARTYRYICHVCRFARIMQIHIPMIAEVKVLQRKTCFMCTICTLWYAECSNGTMNNNSTVTL